MKTDPFFHKLWLDMWKLLVIIDMGQSIEKKAWDDQLLSMELIKNEDAVHRMIELCYYFFVFLNTYSI